MYGGPDADADAHKNRFPLTHAPTCSLGTAHPVRATQRQYFGTLLRNNKCHQGRTMPDETVEHTAVRSAVFREADPDGLCPVPSI